MSIYNHLTASPVPASEPDAPLHSRLHAMGETLSAMIATGDFSRCPPHVIRTLEALPLALMDAAGDAFVMAPPVPAWKRLGRPFGRGRVRA